MARPPKEGSRAWENALYKDPKFIRETVKSLGQRTAKGDTEAADILATYFVKHPELKSMFREYDASAVKIENILIRSLSFGNMLSDIAIREEMAAMKSELILPGADAIDKMLASNVVISHLGHLHATAVSATKTDFPALTAARDRRVTSAQKRLLAALEAYDRIAKAKAKGLRPKGDHKLFESEPVAG